MSTPCCQLCYGTGPSCYAGNTPCSIDQRSQSNSCRSNFNNKCINVSPMSVDGYYNAWTNTGNSCETIIHNNLLTGEDGIQWAMSQMYTLFEQFYTLANNGMQFITSTDNISPSFLTFQNYIQGVCLRNPASCSSALQSLCAQYTRDDLLIYPGLVQMCGCNLPQEEYSKYENLYGLPKSCDPICSRTDVIPAAQANGQPQKCPGTICIIDDINVNITDSRTGNFNFNQSCGGCYGTTTCQCIVSGVSLDVVNSKIGNVVIGENCSGSVDCYQQNPYDPTAPAIKVSCDQQTTNSVTTKDVYTERYEQQSELGISYTYLLLISLIIFFFIVVSFWYLIIRIDERSKKLILVSNNTEKTVERKL